MVGDRSFKIASLPPEIVGEIISWLPHEDRRIALFICHQFYKFAARLVFSTIHLYFGHWTKHEVIEEYRLVHAFDVLEYISTTPEFGRLVRKIVVHAFGSSSGLVFERRCLVKAFSNACNLESFHWTGTYPPIPSEVVTGLATFCSGLKELRVSAIPGLDASDICHLKNLQSFHYVPEWGLWRLTRAHVRPEDEVPNAIVSVINSNRSTLESVSLYGPHAWALPVRSYLDLSELSLWRLGTPSILSLILRDLSQLRSLFVHSAEHFNIASIFEDDALTLPKLAALNVVAERRSVDCQWSGLPDFLCRHKGLRRLSLNIHVPPDITSSYASIIQDMEHLDALGLDMFNGWWNVPYIQPVLHSIPISVRALSLTLPRDQPMAFQTQNLANMLSTLPSLSFLHVSVYDLTRDAHERIIHHDIDASGLARKLLRLRFLGVNRAMSTVRWFYDDASNYCPELEEWPVEILSRSAEDFDGLEEAEWLLRFLDFLPAY